MSKLLDRIYANGVRPPKPNIVDDPFDLGELDGIPVVVASEVASYCEQFAGAIVDDVVATLAPPFSRFWVEFSSGNGVRSWGVFVEDWTGEIPGWGDEELIGWQLGLTLFVELRKGEVYGPMANFIVTLDREGKLLRGQQREAWIGAVPKLDPPQSKEERALEVQYHQPFMFPVLMTLSFLNCRNVQTRTEEAPLGLQKKWRKRHDRDLVRYEVLDINPMKTTLESEGEIGTKGLRHALHVCRGHFKTYTPEKPLLGRASGTFWWADHVRGNKEYGEIVKDYAVHTEADDESDLGCSYIEADENADVQRPSQEKRRGARDDPDAYGRGLRAHNATQNFLAQRVRRAGLEPLSPRSEEPQFDLAFRLPDGTITVGEIKSLTEKNERRQLHLALGQVATYRHLLSSPDARPHALVVVEREPSEEGWIDIFADSNIVLCWPETVDLAIASLIERN